jgi:transcriptional regulator with XRE-family HTH domain
MLFGERLALVRKKKKVSQDELAKAIGVHATVIGRYERSEVKLSIEVATKMAEALGVSLDNLVGLAEHELDNAITKKILSIQSLNEEDKTMVYKTIDALSRDANARKAYAKSKFPQLTNMKILITSLFCFFVSFQTIAQMQSNTDTIYWSPCYKLKFEDFKLSLDSSSDFDAISNITIDYDITQQAGGKITAIKVFCFFNKSKSKTKGLDSSLLIHEQTHFDIAELYSRKLKKIFSQYLLKKNLSLEEAQAIYSQIKNDYKKISEQYDLETDYSKNIEAQLQWNKKIRDDLITLAKYRSDLKH